MQQVVLDIGTKHLCLSIYGLTQQDSYPVLLYASVHNVEGKNNNLLSRLIQRELTKLAENFEINNLIILPRRHQVEHTVIRLEYKSNPQKMKRDLLNNVQLINPSEYITDWTVEEDNPEEDYQAVYASSLKVSEFKFISELMKDLGVRNYKIASPSANLVSLFPKDNKSYLLLQLGHRSTELYIIKNNVCMSHAKTHDFSGQYVTNAILSADTEMSPDELDAFKNNATILDLESKFATEELAVFLTTIVKDFCTEYTSKTQQSVSAYAVIGAMANLDLQNWAPSIGFEIPRIFPRLPVLNHKNIPTMVRNYLMESATILSQPAEGTNFLAPKDKSLGKYVGTITQFFDRVKLPAYLLLASLGVNCITNYAQNYYLSEKINQDSMVVSNYQSEVSALQNTINSLQAQYNELLDDKELSIVNYGDVLNTLSNIIPNGTFVTEIKDITELYINPDISDFTKEEEDKQQQGVVNGIPQLPVADNAEPTIPAGDTQVVGGAPAEQEVNGLAYSSSDMLVALELKGYTNVRYKCFDYALLLKNTYKDAVVTDVVTEDGLYKFTIHVIINR